MLKLLEQNWSGELAVLGSVRGLGIRKALLEQTLLVVKDSDFPVLRVDCSSYYSAKLVGQIGFECVYSLPYSEYKTEDGSQIFYAPIPHVEFIIIFQGLGLLACSGP
jgi:hypothetical protein